MNSAFENEQSQYEYDFSDNNNYNDKVERMDYYDEEEHWE